MKNGDGYFQYLLTVQFKQIVNCIGITINMTSAKQKQAHAIIAIAMAYPVTQSQAHSYLI